MLDLAESKNELLAQIDAYEQNESVGRVIDLAHLRRLVEAFPSPERVREEMRDGDEPTAAVSLIIAAHILEAAAYTRTARQRIIGRNGNDPPIFA